MGLAQVRLFYTIHFGELYVFVLEDSSRFLVMGGQGFAVTTPWNDINNRKKIKNVYDSTMGQRTRRG